jgi:hypothetical protein
VLFARVGGTAPEDARKLAMWSLAVRVREGPLWVTLPRDDNTALMMADSFWLELLKEPDGFGPLYSRKLAIAFLPK